MKLNNVFTTLVTRQLRQNIAPCLLGEAGIGKTEWTKALANTLKTKVFSVDCNLLADKADLTGGRLVPVQNGTSADYEQKFYPHAQINAAIDYAAKHPNEMPILFLDEFNRSNEDVTSAVLSLITGRRIGSKQLPDNLKIMAAGNDRGNTSTLDSASVSRFAVYHIEPDLTTFLLVNPTLHPSIRKVLSTDSDLVCYSSEADDDMDDTIRQFTTPRTLTALSNTLNEYTDAELFDLLSMKSVDNNHEESNALYEVICACIGDTQIAQYLFKQIIDDLKQVNVAGKKKQNSITMQAPARPALYDQMKALQTRDDVKRFVSKLDQAELLRYLEYALHEPAYNIFYIQMLTETGNIDTDLPEFKQIVRRINEGDCYKTNIDYMMNLDQPLSNALVDSCDKSTVNYFNS